LSYLILAFYPIDNQRIELPIRILLVEDHPIVRLGLHMLIEGALDVDIVGEVTTANAALEAVDELKPDVVVMDIGLPDCSGIDATLEIKQRHPEIVVLALTVHDDKEYFSKMLNVGGSGLVSKQAAPKELLTAIRATARGEIYPFTSQKSC
jgi:two-component system response regulator NreC